MLTRYFIFLSFKGTSYHGWQVQRNALTVQKILDEALTLILGEKVSVTGAGRTDAGVHAMFFCAHFDSLQTDLAARKNLIFRINRLLPGDICAFSIKKVVPEANARFSALSRTYKYFISLVKDPFSVDASWFIHGDIDTELMNMASEILMRHSDFSSFRRLHSDTRSNICRIHEAVWVQGGDKLIFTIRADRFLRNMVRAIVGTMIEVGRHRTGLKEFEEIILAKDRSAAGTSAPARGLFLTDIEYPGELFI